MASLTFASWNQFGDWLNKLDGIRQSRFATACIEREVADGVGHVTGDECDISSAQRSALRRATYASALSKRIAFSL